MDVPPKEEGSREQEGAPGKTVRTVEVIPVSKGKRALLFLCDALLCFAGGWLIMNMLSLPIGKAATDFKEHVRRLDIAAGKRNDILYGRGLLFQDPDGQDRNFDSDLAYTAGQFARRFVMDGDPDCEKYDVIKTYYVDIKGSAETYIGMMRELDEKNGYGFFEYAADTGYPVLKEVYKKEFALSIPDTLDVDPAISAAKAAKDLDAFKNRIFLNAYASVTTDIMENGLSYGGDEYRVEQGIFLAENAFVKDFLSWTTYISYCLSVIIFFLIVPLCTHGGRTVSMIMMHLERVGTNNVYLLKKGEVALSSAYHLVSCLGALIFIPLPFIMIADVFKIVPIISVGLLGVLVVIVSAFVLIFNKFSRTLFDVLSRTVIIPTEELDEIYRAKGYPVA